MSANIRLFALLAVLGIFSQQPATGADVAPAASPRESGQGGVSEQMERGFIRPDSGVASPIDNILGSGIKLPPQETGAQSTSPAAVPAPVIAPSPPASGEPVR